MNGNKCCKENGAIDGKYNRNIVSKSDGIKYRILDGSDEEIIEGWYDRSIGSKPDGKFISCKEEKKRQITMENVFEI